MTVLFIFAEIVLFKFTWDYSNGLIWYQIIIISCLYMKLTNKYWSKILEVITSSSLDYRSMLTSAMKCCFIFMELMISPKNSALFLFSCRNNLWNNFNTSSNILIVRFNREDTMYNQDTYDSMVDRL